MKVTKKVPYVLDAKFLMELHLELQKTRFSEIWFDWTDNQTIDSNAIALYLSIKQAFESKNISLNHINYLENQSYKEYCK